MSLERRLRKLEAYSGEKPCPECGYSEATREAVEYEVSWSDGPEKPEFCVECGRQLVFVVTWGDLAWRD